MDAPTPDKPIASTPTKSVVASLPQTPGSPSPSPNAHSPENHFFVAGKGSLSPSSSYIKPESIDDNDQIPLGEDWSSVFQNESRMDMGNVNVNLPMLDDDSIGYEGHHYNDWDASFRTEKQYSSRHTFDLDIEQDTSHLPRINEYSFMDLDRNHFQHACSILQSTIFNVATPMHDFDLIPSKPTNHMRVYQTLAMILHTQSSGADITAVTCDIDFEASPPVFTLYYSKNKNTTTKDEYIASQLCEIVRDYAASNDRSIFFEKIFSFIATVQYPKWQKHARNIVSLTDSAIPIIARILAEWSCKDSDRRKENEDLPGDIFLNEKANFFNCSTIQALALIVKSCGISSSHLTSEVNVERMVELSTLSSVLSTSQLFRDLSSYTTSHEEFTVLKDLWEKFASLGLYYSGTDLLKSYCEDERYRPFLQHLVAKPANMPSESDLTSLNLAYKHPDTRPTEDNKNIDFDIYTKDPLHPKSITDFYDVIHLRRARLVKRGTEIQTGWREDWVRSYPKLADWKVENIHHSVHAEVKLALNMLLHQSSSICHIGISKSPCYCCKIWYKAANRFTGKHFIIPTSHEKVYPGLGLSGFTQLDNFVVDNVWDRLDELIRRVQHLDTKDINIPTYPNSNVTVESICTFGDLNEVFNEALGKW